MKTKEILLKTGSTVTLWLDESTGKYILDKNVAASAESNFNKYILGNIKTQYCNTNERLSILKYYEESSEITQRKVKQMINENIKKIELVYNVVLDSIIYKKKK